MEKREKETTGMAEGAGHISKGMMEEGRAYRCDARNFEQGLWHGGRMYYMRYKWGSVFLDWELHWDDGEPYGTCRPLEALPYSRPGLPEGESPELEEACAGLRG